MSGWEAAAGVLLAAGLAPAVLLSSRRGAVARLVGLQLAGAVAVLLMLVLTALTQQSSYLVVPLVLVLLSYAGTLVFTRLLQAPR